MYKWAQEEIHPITESAGKPRMASRKAFHILVALVLATGVFASGSMAGVCVCGPACSQGLQDMAGDKSGLLFHMRCRGTGCKSCSMETGQSLKAASHVKILNTACGIFVPVDYPSFFHF